MIALLVALTLAASSDPVPVAHRKVVAADGQALALYRFGAAAEGKPAVLMVGDLGESRALWDVGGHGLAGYLADRGYEVYVAELRGQGRTGAPAGGYGLEEWVKLDLPAIAAVMPAHFDLIAHGWGGTLAIAAAGKELKGRVRRIVGLATPGSGGVPNRLAERTLEQEGRLSTLAADPSSKRAFDLLFAMNARWSSATRLLASGALSDLGPRASAELLGWMRDGDLALGDGDKVSGRLAQVDAPALVVLPLADEWAPAELASTMRQVLKGPVKVKAFSRFEYAAEDYSHLSLLMGDGAKTDVFPPVYSFLAEGGR